MARKFIVIVAVIAGVMAALVLLPGVSSQGESPQIEYSRETFYLPGGTGDYESSDKETLNISDDGSARYVRLDSHGTVQAEQTFGVGSDEIKVMKELFLGTGFMQIPETQYPPKAGVYNYTLYHLNVQSGEDSKSLTWVNADSAKGSIPSIIINAGTRLDAIIQRHA
ncbi:MAG TPA: hypothetical protein VJP79_00720 [Nitrososphaera sp.]|nr:hypothetical protein [Nitrososphaera sp.]